MRVKISKEELWRTFGGMDWPESVELEAEVVEELDCFCKGKYPHFTYHSKEECGRVERVEHRDLKHCPNCTFPPNYNCDCSCHAPKSEEKPIGRQLEEFADKIKDWLNSNAPTPSGCCDKCKDIDIDEPNNPLGCAYPTCPCHKREENSHKGLPCQQLCNGTSGLTLHDYNEEYGGGCSYKPAPNHTKIEKLAKVPTGYSDTATLTPHAWNLLADKLNEIIDYLNQL